MDTSTDTLRQLASTWTLAGDEQLLTLLQNTHKRLIQKCQEVNSQLEKMTTALDDASVSLQNVNNQFMALSNTKFVERRVYDDDDVTTEPAAVKEQPLTLSPEAELASLKQSMSVLSSCHEVITIENESDSDCDSDDMLPTRMILKPKDLYADRPLPYIIGSEPWKNKWHVGLVVEDSDSDSSMSEDGESDQYSSEHEDKLTVPRMDATISETSSELPSEPPSEVEPSKPTPSDVANEIARRLGAREPIRVEPPDLEDEAPPKPISRKIYRPQDPVISTIFPDEPPPLDNDIFAELHQPHSRTAPEDLFEDEDDDIFGDLVKPADIKPEPRESTHKQIDSHNVIQQPVETPAGTVDDDRSVKKPVGGISLFGSKGTESIGAAILKRNQRKSTSDEESSDTIETTNQNKTEKDIFNDLFAKNKPKTTKTQNPSINKDIIQEIQSKKDVKVQNVPVKENRVDLFSDNLFDDIDDIFTNIPKTQKDKKPIFEDNDDLFSEIAAPKVVKTETSRDGKKGIFDSDDELFTENMRKTVTKPETSTDKANIPIINKIKDSKSNIDNIFDDEDDIFSNNINVNKTKVDSKNHYSNLNKNSEKKKDNLSQIIDSPSLFDDDDDSDIFAQTTKDKVSISDTPASKDVPTSYKEVESLKHSPNKTKNDNTTIENGNNLQDAVPQVPSVESIAKTDVPSQTHGSKTIDSTVRNPIDIENSEKSDDDFSEQDFDDLPPKIVKNAEKNPQKPIDSIQIDVNNDIFDTKVHKNTEDVQESRDFETKPKENKTEIETNPIDDIFAITEPPTFEKPKEPKRSKNVNALFDDDSDDESLFFKKDDVITDEKPEVFSTQDRLFGIFADEPPDDLDNDIFGPTKDDKRKESDTFKSNNEDATSKLNDTDIIKTDEVNKSSKVLESDIFSSKEDDDKSESDDNDIFKSKYNNQKPKVNISDIFSSKQDKDILQTEDSDIFSSRDMNKAATVQEKDISSSQQDNMTSVIDDNDIFNSKTTNVSLEADNDIFRSKDIKTSNVISDLFTKQENMSDDSDIFNTKDKSTENKIKPGPSNIEKSSDVPTKTKVDLDNKDSDEELFKSPKSHENLFSSLERNQSEVKDREAIDKVTKNNSPKEESTKSLFISKSLKDKKSIFADPNDSLSDDELSTSPRAFKDYGPKSLDSGLFQNKDSKPEIKQEPKKVGKLKIGLNINVNALLPGASPKKVKVDKTDPENAVPVLIKPGNRNREEKTSVTEVTSNVQTDKLTNSQTDNIDGLTQSSETLSPEPTSKTVNFEKESNPEVLDNKLSKDRPKIQVKRRPSTRRARKEAVRKSAIDFGDDSTDNSNSIDDIPKTDTHIDTNINTVQKNEDSEIKITKNTDFNKNEEIYTPISRNPEIEATKNIDKQKLFDIKSSPNRDVKSKIVYILNDEDIFNTNDEKNPKNDIYTESISTLGNVYKQSTNNDSLKGDGVDKPSLFDDEIFDSKAKTSIFDSDSEEVLFSTKKKKVEVKKSLFDDDDDEDLFGVKTKSVEPKPSTSIATKENTLSSEPVFEDPLSMFDSD